MNLIWIFVQLICRFSMCLNPRTVRIHYGNRVREVVVPCGKCIECNHKKRKKIAVECYRTAQKYKDVIFVTYTYRDSALPIKFGFISNHDGLSYDPADSLYSPDLLRGFVPSCDVETGEIHNLRELYFSQKFEVWTDSKCIKHRIHKRYDLPYISEFDIKLSLCPSLDRRSWRMSLKRARVRYQRKHSEPLPEFKYVQCGEYSPVCHRPHYHALFFGLTYSQVKELCEDWNEVYGFTQIKKVKNLKSGQDGRLAVSMYVGKYIVKGQSDYSEALNGFVEKPRRCISKQFGFCHDLDSDLIAHHLAYDVCPYDVDNPLKELNTKDKLFSVLYTIYKRLYYGIQNKKFTLPDGVKRELFYKKVVYEEKTKFVPFEIWRLVSAFIRNRLFADFENAIQCKVQQSDGEVFISELSSLCTDYESQRHDFQWALQKDYDDFLRKVAIK